MRKIHVFIQWHVNRQFPFVCSKRIVVGQLVLKNRKICWNWTKSAAVKDAKVVTKKNANGYTLEASIPLLDLGLERFSAGKSYGLEIAVDNGNAKGRIVQQGWSSGTGGGINTNPSVWGLINIVSPNTEQ